MKKQTIITAVLVCVVGGGAFWGGMAYGKSKTPVNAGGVMGQFQQFQNGSGGRTAAERNMQGANAVSGNILTKDGQSMTIALPNGGSKIIFYSQSTIISKSAVGSMDDLMQDERILVTGTPNSDGSITAQSIQIGLPMQTDRAGMPRPTQSQNQ